MVLINEFEVRIIGALIEKKIATPEYYPLSLNALTNACNQKSSREPVYSLSESVIDEHIIMLREKRLVRMVADGSRVAKYKESFVEELNLNTQEAAIMCVLMLRGPQTTGEIRTRTGRLYDFNSLEEVEATLQALAAKEEPLITKLDRQTGMKERRYIHLLTGTPTPEEEKVIIDEKETRIQNLEDELENLKNEVNELKQQFEKFKLQFE